MEVRNDEIIEWITLLKEWGLWRGYTLYPPVEEPIITSYRIEVS